MTTIRRIYVFVVCFVSLQWGALSVKALLDALLRWLLTGRASDLSSLVFPLAVILVGVPVFTSHWLWAEWSAHRDPAERRCLERHVYLQLSLGLLTAYIAGVIFFGVEALLNLLLPTVLSLASSRTDALAAFISSLPTLAVTGVLWGYHRFVIRQDEKIDARPPAARPGWLAFLGNAAFTTLGTSLIAFGVYGVLDQLLRLPDTHSLAGLSMAAGALAAGGALWTYHQWRLARDPSAQIDFKIGVRWLHTQFFSFVGLALTAAGLAGAQQWLFQRVNGAADTVLPVGLATLLAGLPLLIYHEWGLRSTAPIAGLRALRQLYTAGANLAGLGLGVMGAINALDWLFRLIGGGRGPIPDEAAWLIPGALMWAYYEVTTARIEPTLRWWHTQGLSLIGWLVTVIGLVRLQAWAMGRLSVPGEPLAGALAWLLTGLPVLIYYERLTRRRQPEGTRPVRWLVAWAWHGLGVWMAVVGMAQSLRWLFDRLGGELPAVPFGAPWLVAGALMWAYYRRILARVPIASLPGSATGGLLFLTRLSVFGFSGLGVGLTTLGLIGVQEWLFSRFVGEPVFRLPDALAWLITGLPLWLYFWNWAGRLFASGEAAELKSDLRKAYLYLIIYIAVNGAVITIGLLVNGLLRTLFSLPTQGSLGLSLSIIVASVALWTYHAYVLRSDIRRAGATSLQGGMQRLYWYLVAGVGLLAFLLGLAGTLSAILQLLASLWDGHGFTVALREQMANSAALLVAGLPVWASAWIPAQRAATAKNEDGAGMRRSILRKAYLYLYLLTATLSVLVFAVTIVFQLLNALLGLFRGGNLLADLGQSVGFTVIGAALWAYHAWVLRGDGRFARLERDQAAQTVAVQQAEALQRLRERWASFRVAVVDPGSGQFGQAMIQALRRDLPYLTVIGVGLTPEARAALQAGSAAQEMPEAAPAPAPIPASGASADLDTTAPLADASLIIAPWTAAMEASVAQSQALKLIVPVATAGMQWVGVPPTAATAFSVIQAVQGVLQAQGDPPVPPPETSRAP